MWVKPSCVYCQAISAAGAWLKTHAEHVGLALLAFLEPHRLHLAIGAGAQAHDVVAEPGGVAPAEHLRARRDRARELRHRQARHAQIADFRHLDGIECRLDALAVKIDFVCLEKFFPECLDARNQLGRRQLAQLVVTFGVRRFDRVLVPRTHAGEHRLQVGVDLDLVTIAREGHRHHRRPDFVRQRGRRRSQKQRQPQKPPPKRNQMHFSLSLSLYVKLGRSAAPEK